MSGGKQFPGQQEVPYPGLFEKPPPFLSSLEPWSLTEEQVKLWYKQGYLIIDSLFEPEELAPIKESCAALVEELAEILLRTGRITQSYSEFGFHERLTKMTEEFPPAVLALFKISAKRFPKEIGDLWGHKKLTAVAGQLLGTRDVQGQPVWTVRPKVPGTDLAVAPWHQDSGYFDSESYQHIVITAWIPLLNATRDNGCLQLLPGGHKPGQILDHTACWRNTFYLDISNETFQQQLGRDVDKEAVFAEVPFGGVVLFNNYLPHRSNPHQGEVRWACDFRYMKMLYYSNPHQGEVRWACDFRYMKMDAPGCYHGIADGLQLSSSTDPDFSPDWEKFKDQAKKRYVLTSEETVPELDADEDLFDMHFGGPWMERWPRCETFYTKLYDEMKKKQQGKPSS